MDLQAFAFRDVSLELSPWITGIAAGDGDVFVLGTGDLWAWSSPLLDFRFAERAGPAAVDLAVWGLLRHQDDQACRVVLDPAHLMYHGVNLTDRPLAVDLRSGPRSDGWPESGPFLPRRSDQRRNGDRRD